jgi:hypothetical protein
MIGLMLKPIVPWLIRRILWLLLQAIGRDLRTRLPELFELIDDQIVPSILRGSSSVSALFFTTVQRVIHRDPTALEEWVLRLLFDPAIAAARSRPAMSSKP